MLKSIQRLLDVFEPFCSTEERDTEILSLELIFLVWCLTLTPTQGPHVTWMLARLKVVRDQDPPEDLAPLMLRVNEPTESCNIYA